MRTILALVLLTACARDDAPTETLQDAIADGRTENRVHHDHVLEANSVGAMLDDLDRHELAMDEVMAKMDDAMDDLRDCNVAIMAELDDERFDLAERLLEHRMVLTTAPSLHAARVECEAYWADLIDIFRDMDEAMLSLTCPAG